MVADRAATACCGSTTAAALRGPSLAAVAVLPAARGALDECRLVGTAASDLNTLAGARGALWVPPCERENKTSNIRLSKIWRLGEWSLTSGWRSLASSSLGARRPSWLRPTLPPRHPQSPLRRASVPPRRASPLPWAAWRQALPRPPQALSPLPPLRLLAREAQAPTSRGELVPHRSPPPLPNPTTSTPKSPGKIVSAAHAAGTPHSSVPGAPVAGSTSPSCVPPAPVPTAALRARARARGVGGSDRAAFTVTSCRE
jgi:hypothetical protein